MIVWNANGLTQRAVELKHFITNPNADIILISETHFTTKIFVFVEKYNVFATNHSSGRGHGRSAIIIKKCMQCVELQSYQQEHIQATTIQIRDKYGPLTISSSKAQNEC